MTDVRSAVAVVDRATGALLYRAPLSLIPSDPDVEIVTMPADFADDRYSWDAATRSDVLDPVKLRAARWAAVKARRDMAEWSGCATPLGRVDTDADSQRKVSGAVQMAMIAQAAGAGFAIDWTMQDNEVVAHDAAAMVQMGVLVGQHVAACHAVATALRAAIEAAGDGAVIGAIDIEAGWPA